MWFKEIVTAGLGIVVIISTYALVWPPFSRSPIDLNSAQAIYSVLGGWAGVVLGYYFGRIPSERAATKAEAAASAAEEAKDSAREDRLKTWTEVIGKATELENKYKSRIEEIEDIKRMLEET